MAQNTDNPIIHIGQFFNQGVFDSYWSSGPISGSQYQFGAPLVVTYNSSQLMDSIHVSGQPFFVITQSGSFVIVNNGASVVAGQGTTTLGGSGSLAPQVFIDARIPRLFHKGYEYTFSSEMVCKKTDPSFEARVDVYLSGSAFPDTNPLGKLIASFKSPAGNLLSTFNIKDVATNFLGYQDGQAVLNFVIWSGDWYFANVSVALADEIGFNPDEIFLQIPIKNKRLEHLQFKIELFDVNNNEIPIPIESDPVFFVGENPYIQGVDGRIAGRLVLAPSGTGPVIGLDDSGSYIGIGPGQAHELPRPIDKSLFQTYVGPPIVTIYSGSTPFSGSVSGSAVGIQVAGGPPGNTDPASSSLLDFNTLTGILTVKGDIRLLPGTVLSQSIVGPNSALAKLQLLINGQLFEGTYLTGNSIVSPIIAGNLGYFSQAFGVGNIINNQGIILTALGFTGSGGVAQSGSPAIYIGSGTFNNPNTPFFVGSSSQGVLFSLADKFTLQQIGNQFYVDISGSNISVSSTRNSGSITLGGAINMVTGSGVYIDGQGIGNLRIGNTTTSSLGYVRFDSASAVLYATNLLADNAIVNNIRIASSQTGSNVTSALVSSSVVIAGSVYIDSSKFTNANPFDELVIYSGSSNELIRVGRYTKLQGSSGQATTVNSSSAGAQFGPVDGNATASAAGYTATSISPITLPAGQSLVNNSVQLNTTLTFSETNYISKPYGISFQFDVSASWSSSFATGGPTLTTSGTAFVGSPGDGYDFTTVTTINVPVSYNITVPSNRGGANILYVRENLIVFTGKRALL